MSVHSIQRKKRRDPTRIKYKQNVNCHEEFLARICRTLYYGEIASSESLSLPITEVAVELFSQVKSGRSLDRLGLEEASSISRNACVSPASLVLALLYLERLKMSSPQYLDSVSAPQLFLVSSLIASKLLNDDGEDDEVLNSEWAASADISVTELNKLEKDFLAAINWEVYVESEDFWRRLEMLEEEVSLRQAMKRGFFTYADLLSVMGHIDSLPLAHTLISVGAVCLTAYAAGVASIIGSTAIVTTLRTTSFASLPRHIIESSSDLNHSSHLPFTDDADRVTTCSTDSVPRLSANLLLVDSLSSQLSSKVESLKRDDGCSWWNRSWCNKDEDETEQNIKGWWFKEDQVDSHTVPRYLLSSVVKPLYSYIELVATH